MPFGPPLSLPATLPATPHPPPPHPNRTPTVPNPSPTHPTHPSQVLGPDGSGSYAGVIAGIDWAAANATDVGVKGIISMSLGGGYSSSVNNAVDDAMTQHGVPSVCAAGNSNSDTANFSPASAALAVAVGSTQNDDLMSSFTNWGPTVDVFAPGTAIVAAWLFGGVESLSGTSMATPHVAAVLAALWAENEELTAAEAVEMLYCIGTKDVLSKHPSNPDDHNSINLLLRGGSEVADECVVPPSPPATPPTPPSPPAPPAPPPNPCGQGNIKDCADDDCHPETWLGDGWCDGSDQQWCAGPRRFLLKYYWNPRLG